MPIYIPDLALRLNDLTLSMSHQVTSHFLIYKMRRWLQNEKVIYTSIHPSIHPWINPEGIMLSTEGTIVSKTCPLFMLVEQVFCIEPETICDKMPHFS